MMDRENFSLPGCSNTVSSSPFVMRGRERERERKTDQFNSTQFYHSSLPSDPSVLSIFLYHAVSFIFLEQLDVKCILYLLIRHWHVILFVPLCVCVRVCTCVCVAHSSKLWCSDARAEVSIMASCIHPWQVKLLMKAFMTHRAGGTHTRTCRV